MSNHADDRNRLPFRFKKDLPHCAARKHAIKQDQIDGGADEPVDVILKAMMGPSLFTSSSRQLSTAHLQASAIDSYAFYLFSVVLVVLVPSPCCVVVLLLAWPVVGSNVERVLLD